MKTGAVRAGSLLVGVASVLVLPGVAAGQIDVGQTVGQAVGEVGQVVPQAAPQAPVQAPAVPVQPAAPPQPAPSQPPASAPAAPAPSPSAGGGGGGTATSAPAGGSGSSPGGGGSGSSRAGGAAKGGRALKANASSRGSKKAGKVTVLASQDDGSLTPPSGEDYSGAVTTSPDTGVQGDPELPFTGLQVLVLLAMGAVALAGGVALRTAARRRHAG